MTGMCETYNYCKYCKERKLLNRKSDTPCADAYLRMNSKDRPKLKHKAKQVYQYDLKGNFIKKWNSVHEASDHLDIKPIHIYKCCTGVCKTAGNYIWRYFDE